MEEILDENQSSGESGLVINNSIKEDLLISVKWAKFISIVGFVGLGLMVLGALFMTAMPKRGFQGEQMGQLGIVYLIMAGAYFFPILYLYKFADNMKRGLETTDQMSVNEGFTFLRKHYKYIGILTIVVISLYVLVFLFALIAGASGILR